MKKGDFYYSIMSVRLPKEEASRYCEQWSKDHFLPASRFSVLREGNFHRVVCKVYEYELPLFGFKKLCHRRYMLRRHTIKVKSWLKKCRKVKRRKND